MRLSSGLAAVSLTLIGGISVLNAQAVESPYATLESLDPRFDALVAPDTKIEKIADDLEWSKGPVWNADKGVSRFLERSGYSGAAPFTGREPGSNGLTPATARPRADA